MLLDVLDFTEVRKVPAPTKWAERPEVVNKCDIIMQRPV